MVKKTKPSFKFEEKKVVDILLFFLGVGLIVTTSLCIDNELFKDIPNFNLKDSNKPGNQRTGSFVYTTNLMKAMVITILAVIIILCLLFLLRTFSLFLNVYIHSIKIILTIILLVAVSLLIPSYSYISNTSEYYPELVEHNLKEEDLKKVNKYLLSTIILSYVFVFISLSSIIYDIVNRKKLLV